MSAVTRAEAEAVVHLYNRLTRRCPGVPRDARGQPVGRKVTRSSVEEGTAFLRFCVAQGFDPERFILARHEAIGWRARVPLRELPNVGDNFLDHFRTWGDAAQVDAVRVVEPVEDLDQLGTYAEQLKALHAAGSRETCMYLPDTRGWHPDSVWCQGCPLADPCRLRLPPDRRAKREARAR